MSEDNWFFEITINQYDKTLEPREKELHDFLQGLDLFKLCRIAGGIEFFTETLEDLGYYWYMSDCVPPQTNLESDMPGCVFQISKEC